MAKIYVLLDEIDSVRYVGKTSGTLEFRLTGHLKDAKRGLQNHRCNWIRAMLCRGMMPKIRLVSETCGDGSEEEKSWISFFRKAGVNLTNGTDGGDGGGAMKGRKHSESTLQKMRLAAKGRVISESTKQKLRIANLGKHHTHTEEAKLKMSASAKGRKFSEKTLEKMRLAARGRKLSEETRRKLRVAQAARREREALSLETEQ